MPRKAMGGILISVIVVVVILIIVIAITYKWHLKSREKQIILNKWTMAYPQTTVVRWVSSKLQWCKKI